METNYDKIINDLGIKIAGYTIDIAFKDAEIQSLRNENAALKQTLESQQTEQLDNELVEIDM